MDITDNIKRIREEKRLSQAELSRRLNLDPSAYFRLEKRGNKLTLEQVENFAKALEVAPFELVGITPPEKINDSNEKDVEIAGLKKRIGELERMNELFEGNAYILEAISRKFVNRAIDHAYGIAKHYSSIGHSKEMDRELDITIEKLNKEHQERYKAIIKELYSQGSFKVTLKKIILEEKDKFFAILEWIHIENITKDYIEISESALKSKINELIYNRPVDEVVDEAIENIFLSLVF